MFKYINNFPTLLPLFWKNSYHVYPQYSEFTSKLKTFNAFPLTSQHGCFEVEDLKNKINATIVKKCNKKTCNVNKIQFDMRVRTTDFR